VVTLVMVTDGGLVARLGVTWLGMNSTSFALR